MPDHLDLPTQPPSVLEPANDQDNIRLLSRSPHPYHCQNFELPHPQDYLLRHTSSPITSQSTTPTLAPEPRHAESFPSFSKDSAASSDSGTEADDEHFLKGLPAPRARLNKGLRGRNEALSGTSTPLLSPAVLEEEGRRPSPSQKRNAIDPDRRAIAERVRRRKELIRRCAECLVLCSLAFLWQTNKDVNRITKAWIIEITIDYLAIAGLAFLYPLRVLLWSYWHTKPTTWVPLRIPSSFDPAPLLYPHAITLFLSTLIAVDVKTAVLPNLVLGLCTLPKPLMPLAQTGTLYDPVHWVISCLPLFVFQYQEASSSSFASNGLRAGFDPEVLVLLYPLHQSVCYTLRFLTTTSLLIAELQLLSVSLINLLLLATSPQMVILQTALWGGGLLILILCGQVIRWGITLARVPKWRFKRQTDPSKPASWLGYVINFQALDQVRRDLIGSDGEFSLNSNASSDDEYEISIREKTMRIRAGVNASPPPPDPMPWNQSLPLEPGSGLQKTATKNRFRRHTLPRISSPQKKSSHTTPSGRRKRSASTSVQAFFYLTQPEATARRWLYAIYVQLMFIAIILAALLPYIGYVALSGNETIGWFLGYMFGDQQWFRWKVVSLNLERWILLPPRPLDPNAEFCHLGRIQHIRLATFGAANTRLLMCVHWITIIIFGLNVVFRLSPIYEVDTRRKVFHFLMVAMFLPATYVDPAFAALALTVALAAFLLLDLIRASQLPPLSKPIAAFLTPYVDGRDLRGPVVISHIFLLIGCAIPLWLSLASLPRSGEGVSRGWEVPTREVSMVAGVLCVGLGDAVASLVGRRWGVRKWYWGGGKSLEGSIAFALAVFLGTIFATIWLRIGGWPTGEMSNLDWPTAVRNSGICASMASLTEAVLTGGNDNVIVPVVLWACIKSLGV